MKQKELLSQRLYNQQLAEPSFEKASDLVSWMGAVQAQDYAMSKWAIGLRLKSATDIAIETSIDKGEIVRTHVLRPTWHLISAEDIRWMLKLSAPQILKLMAYYDRQYGVDAKEILRAIRLFEKTLAGHQHMSRPELAAIFSKSKFNCEGIRFGHLLIHAELRGIICSGKRKGNQATYALMEERLKPEREKSRDESLALLAQKYFQSHGPATAKDFAWWSGLPLKEANLAITLHQDNMKKVSVDGADLFFFENLLQKKVTDRIYLLPNYDEYTVAYTDRSAIMHDADDQSRKISRGGNPLFSNNILMKGKVAGLWKRSFKKEDAIITFEAFTSLTPGQQKQLDKEGQRYKRFLKPE